MITTYLDIDELAALIGKSVRAIKRKLLSDPSAVPPKMHIPGSAMLRWRKHEVEAWWAEIGVISNTSPAPPHSGALKKMGGGTDAGYFQITKQCE